MTSQQLFVGQLRWLVKLIGQFEINFARIEVFGENLYGSSGQLAPTMPMNTRSVGIITLLRRDLRNTRLYSIYELLFTIFLLTTHDYLKNSPTVIDVDSPAKRIFSDTRA